MPTDQTDVRVCPSMHWAEGPETSRTGFQSIKGQLYICRQVKWQRQVGKLLKRKSRRQTGAQEEGHVWEIWENVFRLKFLGDNKLYIINNYNSLWINYSNTWTLNLLKWNTFNSTIPNSLQSRTGSETMRTVIPPDWKQQAVSFCVSLWSFCAILWLFCVSLYSFCGHFASFCGCYFPASAPINSYGHFRGKNIQNALKK